MNAFDFVGALFPDILGARLELQSAVMLQQAFVLKEVTCLGNPVIVRSRMIS